MIAWIWAVTLTVADLARAVEFYETILGLQKKYVYNDYAGFDCGGMEIGLKTWGERESPRKGEPCMDLLVADVDETYQVLRARGVEFTEDPQDAQWGGRIASFLDPDGHTLTLTQMDWPRYFAVAARGSPVADAPR